MNVMDSNCPLPVHAGFLCTPNYLVRSILHLDFKTPFMMMMIDLRDIAKMIEDDFVDCLNSEFYYDKVYGKTFKAPGHRKYPSVVWNHVNVMKEDGYEKLKEQVTNFQNVMDKSEKGRYAIFTCFAEIRKNHETVDMAENIHKDAEFLMEVAQKKYPHLKVRLFVFTNNPVIQEKLLSLNNTSIVVIYIQHTMFLWEVSEEYREYILKDIKLGWEKGLEFCKKSDGISSD